MFYYTLYFVVLLLAVLRLLSQNSALGVKVGLRDVVFYGFPYKLRPKPKITSCGQTLAGRKGRVWPRERLGLLQENKR